MRCILCLFFFLSDTHILLKVSIFSSEITLNKIYILQFASEISKTAYHEVQDVGKKALHLYLRCSLIFDNKHINIYKKTLMQSIKFADPKSVVN